MSVMLYIPNEILVGFSTLTHSFSGQRGFITYEEIGVNKRVFNEHKFLQYTDASLEKKKYSNTPKTGFIINKHITKEHDYFGQTTNILIYHPEGFEFEISVANLMDIMLYSNVVNQEIQGELILGWYHNYPYLVPTNSPKYLEARSQNNNLLEVHNLDKDLVIGRTYYNNKFKQLVYLGKHSVPELIDGKCKISKAGHIFKNEHDQFARYNKCQAAYNTEIDPNTTQYISIFNSLTHTVQITKRKAKPVFFSSDIFVDSVSRELEKLINSFKKHYDEKRLEDECTSILLSLNNHLNDYNFYDSRTKSIISFSQSFGYSEGLNDPNFLPTNLLLLSQLYLTPIDEMFNKKDDSTQYFPLKSNDLKLDKDSKEKHPILEMLFNAKINNFHSLAAFLINDFLPMLKDYPIAGIPTTSYSKFEYSILFRHSILQEFHEEDLNFTPLSTINFDENTISTDFGIAYIVPNSSILKDIK